MSTPSQIADASHDAAMTTATATKDEAGKVAASAASAASDVTGTVKEQAGAVAEQAGTEIRDLIEQTRSQVTGQSAAVQEHLGGSIRSLATELRAMGNGEGAGRGPAAEFSRTLGERGAALADYLDSKEPGDVLADLRSFAARRPGGFLLGTLAAGVVAGRVVRGASAADSGSDEAPTTAVDEPVKPPSVPFSGMPVEPGAAR